VLLPRDTPDPRFLAELKNRFDMVDVSACETVLRLLRTTNDLIEAFCEHLAHHGISQGRFTVLMMLNRAPDSPVMPSQLAERCGVTKASITGLVDSLERDGLVERLPSAEDRRAVFVQLSAKGREFLGRLLPHHFARTNELMSEFTPEDHAAMHHLLEKLARGVTRVAALNAAYSDAPPKDLGSDETSAA
jgi:DNA-binding MarR family transcriptional regulator